MRRQISKRRIVKQFLNMELPEAAKALVNKLISNGIRPIVVVMLARAYGEDLHKWREAIYKASHRASYRTELELTETALSELCDTMKANGLIKEFGEATKVFKWFVENFDNAFTEQWREAQKFLSGPMEHHLCLTPEYHNWVYNRFNGIPEENDGPLRTYLESAINDHVAFSTWAGAVYGKDAPDEEDYSRMRDKVAPYVEKALKILLVDYSEGMDGLKIRLLGKEVFL